jgi:replicative DNA helicase
LRVAVRQRFRNARRFSQAAGVAPSLVCLWSPGVCVPDEEKFNRVCALLEVEPAALAPHGFAAMRKNGKNPLTLWLDKLGLWGKGAHAKSIPDAVFRLKRPLLALFLNRLFATDGWATVLAEGQTQLGYCSVSERLARQVQHLLLRFGIIASLRQRSIKYRETRREAWQLDVTAQQSIRVFCAEIGVFGKEEAVTRVSEALERKRPKVCRDVIPQAIWTRLDAARGGEARTALARRAGMGGHTNIHVGRRGLSRGRLSRLATALNDDGLQHLATSDVYWDEIVSIEPAGLKQVYDLTVPDTHNFVANDFCVHNTSFALNIARNIVVDEGQPVFFVSLEQSRIELAERLLCCQARVDSHKLRKGSLNSDDMEKLIEAGGVLRNAKLFIDDTPGQGMLRIAANARRLKLRHHLKLVVIDYLQLIDPDNRRDPRQEQVAQISRRLKFLARELAIPVMALAQVNRSSEDRQDHRPRLADLRESGSIEQDADTVMLLHRPDRYEPGQNEGAVEVIIGKQRNGPTGEITLAYIKQYMRFENLAVGTPFES